MLHPAPRSALIGFIVVALGALAACVTPTKDPVYFDVIYDEREDFSRYGTWDWLPEDAANGIGRRILQKDSHPLLLRLDRLLVDELTVRGHRRDRRNPDFYVTYRLLMAKHAVNVRHHGAKRSFSTRSNQGIFDIEGPELKERVIVTAELHIGIAAPSQRITWMGTFRRSVEMDFAPHLDDAVHHVLDHFPPPAESLEARSPGAPWDPERARRALSGTLSPPFLSGLSSCWDRPGASRCLSDALERPS